MENPSFSQARSLPGAGWRLFCLFVITMGVATYVSYRFGPAWAFLALAGMNLLAWEMIPRRGITRRTWWAQYFERNVCGNAAYYSINEQGTVSCAIKPRDQESPREALITVSIPLGGWWHKERLCFPSVQGPANSMAFAEWRVAVRAFDPENELVVLEWYDQHGHRLRFPLREALTLLAPYAKHERPICWSTVLEDLERQNRRNNQRLIELLGQLKAHRLQRQPSSYQLN